MVMEFAVRSPCARAPSSPRWTSSAFSPTPARALRLHASGHVHRDVKARNVLIERGHKAAKLCDFATRARAPHRAQTRTNPTGLLIPPSSCFPRG